jgi:hypothetical protein
MKSFELIVTKLFPDETLNNAVTLVLKNKIFPILPKDNIINSDEITDAMNRINNKGIQYFLEELKPVIYPLYQKFSDGNETMIFSMFLEFYTQFELFPEMISLTQMKTIFFALTEPSNNNNNSNNNNYNDTMNSEYKNSQIQMEKLNFDLFIQALAITAMFFNYKDIVTDLDRLLYLCYSIYYSKPIQEHKLVNMTYGKINKNFSDFLKDIKQKFEKKKKEERVKSQKEKMNQTNKETIQQLDLQFDFNEDNENKEEILNSYF